MPGDYKRNLAAPPRAAGHENMHTSCGTIRGRRLSAQPCEQPRVRIASFTWLHWALVGRAPLAVTLAVLKVYPEAARLMDNEG